MNLVDDYEVVKHIGKGSFSNVYLCKQDPPVLDEDEVDKFFIIKEININELVRSYVSRGTVRRVKRGRGVGNIDVNVTPYSEDSELMNTEHEYYFRRLEELIDSEIQVLEALDHPNVIKFYGYTKRDGIYYLRMEYCDGGDVYDFLKGAGNEKHKNESGGFTNLFLYEFLQQTVSGLKYIHDRNLIHRDIKLHNVLIKYTDNDIQFKISDFGFACYDLTSHKDPDMTEVLCKKYYKLCGTPYYMAPEIILNMSSMENIAMYKSGSRKHRAMLYNKRIDVWSLGICIYELMYNILPFSNIRNVDDLERFYKLHNIQAILDKKIRRRVSLRNGFKDILLAMIRIDRNERLTIDDVYRFLQGVRSETDLVDTVDQSASILDIINCRENTYLRNEGMKADVVTNPLHDLDTSWEKINKSSSLIMKMSVQTGFLQWLFNK